MSRGKPICNENGEATHYLGIVIEITERKLAEEALRESEIKHRRLFENMTHGVVYQSAPVKLFRPMPLHKEFWA